MKLNLLPDGRPGEHLGLSHTLKHYLRPNEMWEDLAEPVPENLRPRAVCDGLPAMVPPVWEQWQSPDAALVAEWNRLRVPYRKGYGALLKALTAPLSDPPQAPWVRHERGHAVHAGEGVVVVVRRGPRGDDAEPSWSLYSAYRPFDFKLPRHECPPRDVRSVLARRCMARHAADRLLSSWRQDKEQR